MRFVVLGDLDRVDMLDNEFATLPGVIVREERLELLFGSILRLTLDEVTMRFMVLGELDRLDLPDDTFAALLGVTVREARLELLAEEVDTVRLCDAADRLLPAVLATSTVRLTGRDRVALLRDERLEDVWDDAGLEGVDGVDLLDRELEGRDALGAAGAGVDGLLRTDCDERDDLDAAGVDLCAGADCLGAGVALGALGGVDDRADRLAWGADFVCDRAADFEIDSARLLRPSAGTISTEPRNKIPTMRTNCL